MIFLGWISALLRMGCAHLMPQAMTVPGPETNELLPAVTGYVVLNKPPGSITALHLPTLKESIVRPKGLDHLRFSLVKLMLLVFVAALLFGALRFFWPVSHPGSVLSAGLLSAGLLGVLFCRGSLRLFCLGFEAFGWGFQLWTFGHWQTYVNAINQIYMYVRFLLDRRTPGMPLRQFRSYEPAEVGEPLSPWFATHVDWATTLLCALVGGLLAWYFFIVRHRPKVFRELSRVEVQGRKSEATHAAPGLLRCMAFGSAYGIVIGVYFFTYFTMDDGLGWFAERVTVGGLLGMIGGLAVWTFTSPWPTVESESSSKPPEEDTK